MWTEGHIRGWILKVINCWMMCLQKV